MDHRLRIFLMVAKHGNFSRAAEELHMSQPAVSQQIQALEEELGVKLFERTTKRVVLTRAGRVVEHYSKELETDYEAMLRRVEDLKDVVAGTLVIGASYTFGEYVLPYVVAEFLDRYPQVHPNIQIANTVQVAKSIQEETVDVGIVEGRIHLARVESIELMRDRMVVIASPQHPAYNARGPLKVSSDTTWILREKGSGTRTAANETLHRLGIHPKSVMEFSSTQVIKTSVQAGLGLSVLSDLVIQSELAQGTLVALSDKGVTKGVTRPFYLLKQESSFESRVAQEFQDFLVEYIRLHYSDVFSE